jgi:uncharacterized membrane protein YdjX (TVP38/TMEM64 family)
MKQILSHNQLALVTGIVVVILFISATVAAQTYADPLELYVAAAGKESMLVYVLITALGTIVAPISTVPLIPIAAQSWGWITAGVLSIIGWVIGSQIAFLLARRYGTRLVGHFVPLQKIRKYEDTFSKRNLFFTVVLLRMSVPVDVLSYALGLFSSMSAKTYLLATTIGVIPFAFVFAYTGTLPPGLQIIVLIEIILFFVLIYCVQRWLRNHKHKQ